jgi:hypothetical protein
MKQQQKVSLNTETKGEFLLMGGYFSKASIAKGRSQTENFYLS